MASPRLICLVVDDHDHPLHRSLVALAFLVAILLLALPPSFYLWCETSNDNLEAKRQNWMCEMGASQSGDFGYSINLLRVLHRYCRYKSNSLVRQIFTQL